MRGEMRDAMQIEIVENRVRARERARLRDQRARLVPFARPVRGENAFVKDFQRHEFRIGAGQPVAGQSEQGLRRTVAAPDIGFEESEIFVGQRLRPAIRQNRRAIIGGKPNKLLREARNALPSDVSAPRCDNIQLRTST